MNPIEISRPSMPDGYGLPESDEGLLEWSKVEARLVDSLHYWMATVRLQGPPHVVPRWGVWLDSSLYYDGAPATRHVQNLNRNPACTLHLEDGAQAIIVEGSSGPVEAPGLDLGERISEAMCHKYSSRGYSPGPESWKGADAGGLCRFVPRKALAWLNFPTDMSRFRFDG